jgi:hypothetical protein
MRINEINEAPMGLLARAGNKIVSKIPGNMGATAQGKLDTGKVANKWRRDYATYLGRTGQKPSTETLTAFLQSLGMKDASSLVGESVIFERPLTSAEVDKIMLKAAQMGAGAASGGAGGGAPAGGGSPAPAGGSAPEPAADAGGAEEPAAGGSAPPPSGSLAPAGGGAPAPSTAGGPAAGGGAPEPAKPGLLRRAAGAVGGALKRAVGGAGAPAGGSPAPAGGGAPEPAPAGGSPAPAGSAPTPTPAAPTRTAGGTVKQDPAGGGVDTYVNNWAKTINAAKTPQEKINLAKEVINFLKDRKGSPEGQRGAAMAKAVLKRSGDPTLAKMAQSGAFAMERRMYVVANAILEATGLTWKMLGMRIDLNESNLKIVTIRYI